MTSSMTATARTIVHVMRHGEVHNPAKILYGRLPDYHLSERGRLQAQSAADWLARNDVVYVVASPLERAQETAAPIAALPCCPLSWRRRRWNPGNWWPCCRSSPWRTKRSIWYSCLGVGIPEKSGRLSNTFWT